MEKHDASDVSELNFHFDGLHPPISQVDSTTQTDFHLSDEVPRQLFQLMGCSNNGNFWTSPI